MENKIMFVDDEQNVLRSLEWLFTDEPYRFYGFASPIEALNAFARHEFSVVVADQRMVEMKGTEFLEKVKSQYPDTVRILATAYADVDVTVNAINQGNVFRFLIKPWDDKELKQTIGNAVAHYDLLSENRRLITILQAQNSALTKINARLEDTVESRTSKMKQNEAKRRKLEEQLLNAQKMEAIGTFARGIAHDFNNILSVIMACNRLARMNLGQRDPTLAYLDKIDTAGVRAKELTQQIFSFCRRNDTSLEPQSIEDILDETMKLLRPVLPGSIKIDLNLLHCGPVMASEIQVHQVIMNLCTNAYHAMGDEGGILSFELSELTMGPDHTTEGLGLTPGRYVRLDIGDTGPGIEQGIIERIFEPYFTTKTKGKGTGLGLSVAHGIVKNLGGALTAHNKNGQGAVFTVLLPSIAPIQ